MSMRAQSEVGTVRLTRLKAIRWRLAHSPDIVPDAPTAERDGYGEGVLAYRLRGAMGSRGHES